MELHVESLCALFVAEELRREGVDEVFGQAVENVRGSDVEDLGYAAVTISGLKESNERWWILTSR